MCQREGAILLSFLNYAEGNREFRRAPASLKSREMLRFGLDKGIPSICLSTTQAFQYMEEWNTEISTSLSHCTQHVAFSTSPCSLLIFPFPLQTLSPIPLFQRILPLSATHATLKQEVHCKIVCQILAIP